MFEAYAIGVTLKLNNLISPQLLIISQEFTKLEAQATAVGAVLKKIGAEAAGLKSVAAAGNASSVALDRASRSASAFERH
ncbi:phage tail protein, partial [Salmonella enterica]|nr:phage tail protein [Salmonella enterica]